MKSKVERLVLLFCLVSISLILLEIGFYFLKINQSEKVLSSAVSVLQNEMTVSNSYLISRSLANMEAVSVIECVQLKELSSRKIFFDSSTFPKCKSSIFDFLSGPRQSLEIRAINGASWVLDLRVPMSFEFAISFWLLRIFLSMAVVFALLFYWYRMDSIRSLLLLQERQIRKLNDIADQVAHDVVSPLSAIGIVSGHPGIPGELRDLLKMSVERSQKIVSDLKNQLKFAKTMADQSNHNLLPEDISKLVREVVKEKEIECGFKFDVISNGQAIARVNRTVLQRIISNLLNNAIEAIDTQNGKIKVLVAEKSKGVQISISDNGKGFSSEILKKIGEKGLTFGKAAGSGLGIYYAKKSIEEWGGTFCIDSSIGTGATITLNLAN